VSPAVPLGRVSNGQSALRVSAVSRYPTRLNASWDTVGTLGHAARSNRSARDLPPSGSLDVESGRPTGVSGSKFAGVGECQLASSHALRFMHITGLNRCPFSTSLIRRLLYDVAYATVATTLRQQGIQQWPRPGLRSTDRPPGGCPQIRVRDPDQASIARGLC
jgi:hypothetical protein